MMAQPRSHSTYRRVKTPADYRVLAQQHGFRWLGSPVPDTQAKTTWRCPLGHRWQASYNTIRQGHGCPVCAGVARKTPADYRVLARQRGLRWLGPEVRNSQTKTGWQCAQGHRWQTTYNRIQQGRGCPLCGGTRLKTPTDYRALARMRGLKWIGPEVNSCLTKTNWQCSHGHRWQTTYHSIQQGSGCPVCRGYRPKTPADYRQLATERGVRWLGPVVSNVLTQKTRWRCALGHEWLSSYSNLQQGHGCPICNGRRKTPVYYQQLAIERGLQWLGPEVPTVQTKTHWRCALGHKWTASYRAVQRGHGCPICRKR